ncbi:hypothetical protein [Flavobacterium terrae]|nr:hypothetical protein [Flavobacterium terrae]
MSCKNEINSKNENIVTENDKNMISEVLKKQLKEGANQYISEAGVEIPKKEFESIELDAVVQIVKEKLNLNGYRVISEDEFKNRIEKIFKRIIDFNSRNKYLYISFLDKCNKEFSMLPSNKIDFYGTYIIKNEKFITDFYFIPELVNYQNDYQEVAKIENSLSSKIKNENGTECSIEFWKDISDLSNQRQSNIQKIMNRNKFLFNDDKASLTWLKTNDVEFLEILVKTFGYVEDKELTKFVLDKNLKDDEEFGKVIWTKTCDGKLHFNEEIVKIIKDSPQKYIEPVENYLRYLYNSNDSDLAFSQKAEIMGKLAYHLTKIVDNQSNDYYNFFPSVSSEEFQKEFESKNYYNIKDFQSIYEETKTGGVAYPGME